VACMYVYVSVYMYACMYDVRMYVCTCVCVYVRVCVCMYVCVLGVGADVVVSVGDEHVGLTDAAMVVAAGGASSGRTLPGRPDSRSCSERNLGRAASADSPRLTLLTCPHTPPALGPQ
jgi:hypothetical protein